MDDEIKGVNRDVKGRRGWREFEGGRGLYSRWKESKTTEHRTEDIESRGVSILASAELVSELLVIAGR